MKDVVLAFMVLSKFHGTEVQDGYIIRLVAAARVIGGDVSDLMELLSDF